MYIRTEIAAKPDRSTPGSVEQFAGDRLNLTNSPCQDASLPMIMPTDDEVALLRTIKNFRLVLMELQAILGIEQLR